MSADDLLASDPTPSGDDDLAAYIPRAIEILTCYKLGEHAMGRDVIGEYTWAECRKLLSTMAAIAAGLLTVAYNDTDMSEDEWMPHFGAGLTGMFTNEDD